MCHIFLKSLVYVWSIILFDSYMYIYIHAFQKLFHKKLVNENLIETFLNPHWNR